MRPVCIDFETFGIIPRPQYPPKPVGVSIKYPGKPARYYAWGHPTGNNCKKDDAIIALSKAWCYPGGILCHNLKFDYDVATTYMGMPVLPWNKMHDTMLLLFLDDPHSSELALKPSAERLLGMPPEEQDEVRDWLINNQPVDGMRITKSNFGAYIAHAPGDLVGKYANGDAIRTERLFDLLLPSIEKRKMKNAYIRERRLIPILLEIERQGIRIDLASLEFDVTRCDGVLKKIDQWIRKKIKVGPDFNIDADQKFVRALASAGLLSLDKLGETPKSRSKSDEPTYKSDKESISDAMLDATMAGVIQYRSQLMTCVNTFMRPWLATATQSGGFIFTEWHQTRSEKSGARTGRFSSSPNFQNIPKTFKPIFKHEKKGLPKAPFDLPALPLMRSYIVPFKRGHVLLDRDYSQQELRILAHFEDGQLLNAYLENPWLDVHDHATNLMQEMGLFADRSHDEARKPVKNTGFGLIYGMGIAKLAAGSGIDYDTAKRVKNAYLQIFPGLRDLTDIIKERSQKGEPIRTWGGREYYCEPPRIIDGEMRTFDYKMLNVLIQGSAADCTKEALIRYWEAKEEGVYLLLSVHDEILVSCPEPLAGRAMITLKKAMEGIKFDVPMLSEGTISKTNWAEMKDYDKKGKDAISRAT